MALVAPISARHGSSGVERVLLLILIRYRSSKRNVREGEIDFSAVEHTHFLRAINNCQR